MYLGDMLGGVPEWQGPPKATGWSQSIVDARWREIGQSGPAPIVPATMIGWATGSSKGPRLLKLTKAATNLNEVARVAHVNGKGLRGVTKQEADFLNFWGQVAVDPYHKQSGISKVAGGILQVASVVIPAMGYAQAIAAAGNAGLQYGAQGGNEKLAARVMEPAYAAQEAKDDAKTKADFDAQVSKLQALAPVAKATPSAPPALTAQPVDLTQKPATSVAPRKGWTNSEISVAAIFGGVLLLGALRR